MLGLFAFLCTFEYLLVAWPMVRDMFLAIVLFALFVCLVLSTLAYLTGQSAGPRNRWWFRFGWTAFGMAAGAMLLPLLVVAVHTAQQQAERNADQRWLTHSIGFGYTISAAEAWQRVASPDRPGTLYLVNSERDLHLLTAALPKIDATYESVEELQQFVVSQLNVSDAEVSTTPVLTKGRVTAVDTQVLGTVENVGRLLYRFRHQEMPDAWIEIQIWGLPSHMLDDRNTVDRILTSARSGG